MKTISLSDFKDLIGKDYGLSRWIEIDQARIDAFADCTGDRQFIHVDPVRAAASPFGGTVAHGFLTLSLLPAMTEDLPHIEGAVMGVNYGLNRLRFIAPVPAGSRVRGRFRLDALDRIAPDEVQIATTVTVEIEGAARPALVAEWLTRQRLG